MDTQSTLNTDTKKENPLIRAFHAAKNVFGGNQVEKKTFNSIAEFKRMNPGELSYAGGVDKIPGLPLLRPEQLRSIDTAERSAANNVVGSAVGVPSTTTKAVPSPRPEYNLPIEQKNKVIATMLAEAISDGEDGLRAVMNVINNRIGTPSLRGKQRANVFDVVSEPKQFSGFSTSHEVYSKFKDYLNGKDVKLTKKEQRLLDTAVEIYRSASLGELDDTTNGALQYYNDALAQPTWGEKLKDKVRIGSHVFGKL